MVNNLKTATSIVGIVLLVSLTVLVNIFITNQVSKSRYIGLDHKNLPSIQLKGEGTVYATPDTARISLTVLTQAPDTSQALSDNNRKMEAVIEYLKAEGVEENNIRTTGFNIRPLQERIEDPQTGKKRTEIYAYRVINTVEADIKDIEKAGKIASGAVEAGANRVDRLQFIVSREEEYKKEARRKAVRQAKERGEEIADSLGVELGRLLNFSEDRDFFRPMARAQAMETADRTEVPLEPGENEIKANVTLEYEIR